MEKSGTLLIERDEITKKPENIESGEFVVPDFENMSEKEYISFLEKLDDYKGKDNLFQEDISKIIEKGIHFFEKNINSEIGAKLYEIIRFHGEFVWNDPNHSSKTFTEKAYKAIIQSYENNFKATSYFMEKYFYVEPIVQPKFQIPIVIDACKPDSYDWLARDFAIYMDFNIEKYGDVFDDALISQIDFINPKNFTKTGKFLEFVALMFNEVQSNGLEYLSNKLMEILRNFTESSQGNYYLNLRAREILAPVYMSDVFSKKYTEYVSKNNEELVLPRSHKTDFSMKEDENDVTDYNFIVGSPVRKYIENEFKIDLDLLDEKEKYYFLKLIKQKNQKDLEKVKEFTDKYKDSGFKSFLSIDYGMDMGDKILKIGNTLDKETAQKIFDKYAELVSQLDNVGNILAESYNKETNNNEEILKIKEAILKKGKDLLVHFSDMISEGKEISAEETIDHLQKIEAEATTFFLAFKTLKDEKQLPALENIKGISFSEKNATELSAKEKETIEKMYEENYKNNPEFLKTLINLFEERVARPDTRFYTLEYGDKLRASIGFTPVEGKNAIYLHSVNVENALHGISIGNTMMEKAIDNEAGRAVIEADCAAYEKIGAKYIETGFVGTSQYSYEGFPAMSIVRDEKKNGEYWGKQMKGREGEIVDLILSGSLPENVLAESANEQKDISMDALSNGYVLTRYFRDKDSKKWYVVFEKV
jgi:hypothetical protein